MCLCGKNVIIRIAGLTGNADFIYEMHRDGKNMQYFRLIMRTILWCLLMSFTPSVWANQLAEIASLSQVHNLAMANLTAIIQDTTGEPVYCHYLVKNTGSDSDNIYPSSEIVFSTGGIWTIALVPFQTASTTLASPQSLSAVQTLSFFVRIIPPTDAILGSCTVKVRAVNSYFYEHAAGDGLPIGGDADAQQDMITIRLIPPSLTIMATTPSESSLVPRETLIEAVFNMDPAKWGLKMILWDESHGINVPGTIISQNNKLSFIPDTMLLPSSSYMVSISGSEFVYKWRFETMAGKDKNEQINGIQTIVNYPNPFNMNTDSYIAFSPLPADDVVIEIYTMDDKLVQTLNAQNGICLWNGKNKNGDMVSSGIYVYVVKMKALRKKGTITVIR